MSNRKEEIECVLSLIQNLCKEFNICLLPMEKRNLKYVGIHDNIENKLHCMITNNQKK